MNMAAFAVVGMLQRDPRRFGGLGGFAGLAGRAPWLAAGMAILLLAVTGIPPNRGFFDTRGFYAPRGIVYMSVRDPGAEPAPIDRSPLGTAALAISVVGVLLLGLFPEPVLAFLQASVSSVFSLACL